jgi:hypothetical protein
MFFRIKILSFIYYLQIAGSHHVFQKKKLCFIYYQQVAGSHKCFQNKNIMFYILPTSCRISYIKDNIFILKNMVRYSNSTEIWVKCKEIADNSCPKSKKV